MCFDIHFSSFDLAQCEERLVSYDEERVVLILHFCRSLYLCVVSIDDYVVIILGFLM